MSPVVNSKLELQHHHQQQFQHQNSVGDDELSCKICLSTYNQRSSGQRPRTLHCQHTFCESCLQGLAKGRGQHNKLVRTFMPHGSMEESGGSVRCPLCKCRTHLGPSSVQGLPINSTAIKRCAEMSGRQCLHGRPLDETQPRQPRKDFSFKGNSKTHFMSGGTAGNRVIPQRFASFHPPPTCNDGHGNDWSSSRPHRRTITFADNDELATNIDCGFDSCFSPGFDAGSEAQCSDVFVHEMTTSSAVELGRLGTHSGHSPSSIACSSDGRLVVVDANTGQIQLFARTGDPLSGFHVAGARAACFIEDGGGHDQSLCVAVAGGVMICDETGRQIKLLPIGSDVVAVASKPGTDGGFVAAHRNRVTICDRYKPTAVLRSISSMRPQNAPLGHPGIQFNNILALATSGRPDRLYVIDSAEVLIVDVNSATLLHSITPADRLLRQPSAVAVDAGSYSLLVSDSSTGRLLQFDANGSFWSCVVELAGDAGRCVALAVGSQGHDGRQLAYVACRDSGVRIYEF